MKPDELDALAVVMLARGVFKVRRPDGGSVEMSAAALAEAAAERANARGAALAAEQAEALRERGVAPPGVAQPATERAPQPDEDDAMLYAATEGMPA